MNTDTLEQPRTTLPTVARADILLDLLSGASVAVGTKSDPVMLQDVYLSAKNYVLTARATNHYRLVIGTTKAIVGIKHLDDGDMEAVALAPEAIKALKLFLSARKMTEVTLTVEDQRLTVSQLGQQVTVNSNLTREFPPTAHLFPDSKPNLEDGEITLNLKLIASFEKIPSNTLATLKFNTASKAINIELGHEFIRWECLLMPARKR